MYIYLIYPRSSSSSPIFTKLYPIYLDHRALKMSRHKSTNVGKTMPLAPSPSHQHFYSWRKQFPVMGGLLLF